MGENKNLIAYSSNNNSTARLLNRRFSDTDFYSNSADMPPAYYSTTPPFPWQQRQQTCSVRRKSCLCDANVVWFFILCKIKLFLVGGFSYLLLKTSPGKKVRPGLSIRNSAHRLFSLGGQKKRPSGHFCFSFVYYDLLMQPVFPCGMWTGKI